MIINKLLRIVAPVLFALLLTGCYEKDGPEPCNVNGEIYLLFNRAVNLSPGAQTVELESIERGEFRATTVIPLTFIKEDYPLKNGDHPQFESHSPLNLGEIFGGLYAEAFYLEQGYDDYPDSPDFMFNYKWLAATSYFDKEAGVNRIILDVEENTTSVQRIMCVHFYNGNWGCLWVVQAPATDG